jgi:hypothetical protein
VSAALARAIDYVENGDKTHGGELVAAYECDPMTAEAEFMLSKVEYENLTGLNQGKNDIVACHVWMSFPPGEAMPEEVLEIGRELAARWTKGKHQYVVAAHTNTNITHCHIIYNSTTLDCMGKFKNFKFSSTALRRLSDQICAEHGLSIIAEPGRARGWNRSEYLADEKPKRKRDELQDLIDANLVIGQSFGAFLAKLKRVGCEVKTGKHIVVKLPGGSKFIRFDSCGDGYTQEHILERLRGVRDVPKRGGSGAETKRRAERAIESEAECKAAAYMESAGKKNAPNLLIDIQAKLRDGKGEGYRQWALIFNLKSMARTLIWLKENNIDSYEDLKTRASAAIRKSARLRKSKGTYPNCKSKSGFTAKRERSARRTDGADGIKRSAR